MNHYMKALADGDVIPDKPELRDKREKAVARYKKLLNENPEKLSPQVAKELRELEHEIEVCDQGIAKHDEWLQQAADAIGIGRSAGNHMKASEASLALAQYYKTGDASGFGPRNSWTESSDGGVIVPRELYEQITLAQQKYSPLRGICRILQTKTAHSNFDLPVAKSGAVVNWVGETDTRSVMDTPVLASIEFPDCEMYTLLPVSDWMLSDTMIADFIQTELARAFGHAEGEKFLSGNGTKQPKGLLSYTFAATDDDTRAWGQMQYIASGTAATLGSAEKLIDLCYSLRSGYRANATWVMNASTLATVRKLKDSQNRFLWEPGLNGQQQMLMGYPIVEADHMPNIGAGNIPILFGDFQCYGIVDREMSLQRDPFTMKPYTVFYGRKRTSGALIDSLGIKGLKIAEA